MAAAASVTAPPVKPALDHGVDRSVFMSRPQTGQLVWQ